MTRKIKLEPGQMRADFRPSSFNEEKRTMDVVWAVGARVKRYGWDGEYYEELSMKRAHVNLDRLKRGASVLNNHGTGMFGGVRDLGDVIGVVEDAWIEEGKEGVATIRFSSRPEVQGIVQDIKDGIIRNLSVGYKINKMEELKQKSEDGFPVLRAVSWEPMEISFVAIPADAAAQSRSTNKELLSCEVVSENQEEETDMPKKKGQRSESEEPKEEPVIEEPKSEEPKEEPVIEEPEAARAMELGKQEEAKRQIEIRKAVKLAGLGDDFADKFTGDVKITLDNVRAEIFKELETRSNKPTFNNFQIEEKSMEQKIARRNAVTNALLHRMDPTKYKLNEGENVFVQGSILDLARKVLSMEGTHGDVLGMSRSEIVKRALHSTSDFSEILANTAGKSLRDAYMGAPNTYSPFVSQRIVEDFKEVTSLQIGNGGKLEKVNEHGEYKRTTLGESAEKYKVEKYGIIIGKTYELMMNDDLGAFTRIPAQLGIRAREKENQVFWALILGNQVMMEDNKALFHVDHNNLVNPGTAISVASLGALRSKMRLQKDLDGELMNLAAQYIVLPTSLETVADQFLSQNMLANQSNQINPFAGKLIPVVEPLLDGNSSIAWYLAASQQMLKSAEHAVRPGGAPEVFVKDGWDVDGQEFKIRHEFGMRIVDYRGFQKNLGA
jgi:phage head maturation protease